MKIVSTQYYRSNPQVNVSTDMVRVTLDLNNHEWRVLQRYMKDKDRHLYEREKDIKKSLKNIHELLGKIIDKEES